MSTPNLNDLVLSVRTRVAVLRRMAEDDKEAAFEEAINAYVSMTQLFITHLTRMEESIAAFAAAEAINKAKNREKA